MSLAVLAACGTAPTAIAAPLYSYVYTAATPTVTVPVGGAVTVPIYLRETRLDGTGNSLLSSEHGLSTAGFSVSRTAGSTEPFLSAVTANTGAPPNGFSDPASAATLHSANSATVTESVTLGVDTTGVMPGPQSGGVSLVHLGSVTVSGGPNVGQTATFVVSVADASLGSTFTNDAGYDIDNAANPFNPAGAAALYFSAAATSFQVTTVVPEPAAVALLGAVVILRRRRR